MIHHLQVFEKVLHLALLRLMDYCELQQSQFVRVCLWSSKVDTEKFGLCLHLETVDICSRFGLNCIKTYLKCVCVQLFLNYAPNTFNTDRELATNIEYNSKYQE